MRRPERVVGIALLASIAGALALVVVYWTGGQPQAEGALLFVALGGLGIALMFWAKGLLAHIGEATQPRRHPADEAVGGATEAVEAGVDEIRRRRFLSRLLAAAVGALGLAALFPIRSLGGAPGDALARTPWRAGMRLTTLDGDPVSVGDLDENSVTTVFPEGHVGSSDGQAVLIRLASSAVRAEGSTVGDAPEGYVCYSKLCTHAGCPLGLYLAATQELRCPCHQSTFAVLDGARPVYGPAARALPRLPIAIDEQGYLIATGGFDGPVGPSWWNMPR